MSEPTPSPFSRNEWLGLAVGTWIAAGLLFALFGLHGPFGRYSLAIELGLPCYLTYKFFTSESDGKSNSETAD
jgi:hypothetical protein